MEKEMENGHLDESKELLRQRRPRRSKGGLVTMPFIIANEALEKVASYGLLPNMILYLIRDYGMGVTQGTNILFYWSAATNFMPVLGAFLADAYLGRFLTIGLGSICSLTGMVLLWLTAMIPQARPSPCNPATHTCKSASAGQYTMLISSFALMSIGAGGVRPCSLAFGADQLVHQDKPQKEGLLERFFGWYYASAAFSVVIALTGIVYIQDHLGWKVGFGVPAALMTSSVLLFFLAAPLYVKMKASTSLFTGFAQVIVAAYKNRKLPLPLQNSGGYLKGSEFAVPTDKLKFLNKACIIQAPEDISPDGTSLHPWQLCTADQVEQLKALIKVLPLWSTGIMLSLGVSNGAFPLLQANSMDRHVTKNFQIPAGSFGTFTIITIVIWVILYDRVILPVASKIRGKPVRLGVKTRMGIGLFLSCVGTFVGGLIEHIRRKKAIEEGFLNNPYGKLDMSAMWLILPCVIGGLAEAFNAIGQTEFYYSEFPKSMSSVATSLFGLGMAVANLLASVVLSLIDDITKKGGKESWVSDNINKGHYDYYYWVLGVLGVINVFYFVICSWAYGPCVENITGKKTGESELEMEKLPHPGSPR